MSSIKMAPALDGPSIFMEGVKRNRNALEGILSKINSDLETLDRKVGDIEEGGFTSDFQLIMA